MKFRLFAKLTKITVSLCLTLALMLPLALPTRAQSPDDPVVPISENASPSVSFDVNCPSAILMEAIDDGRLKMTDMVTASAHAASMGGSQIYLKEGEQMSAEDMIKSVVISSANDAAVALAEHIAGSEASFVAQMNQKAKDLGMNNTHFENTNGLDDTAEHHVTSARDIALMSQALIAHEKILQYSSIWVDTIRGGEFGLTNTNRLVRYYQGCNGLKTGSTQKAGFCISATACRDGMTLICVIMGAESRDIRNATATQLLDWGFANYGLYTYEGKDLGQVQVMGGERAYIHVSHQTFTCVLPKSRVATVDVNIRMPEVLSAPVQKNENVGLIEFCSEGEIIGQVPICAGETSLKMSFWQVFWRMVRGFLLG